MEEVTRALALVALTALGCAHPAPPRTRSTGGPMTTTPNRACADALHVVLEMKLDQWKGLPSCSRADVEALLGALPADGGYPARPGAFTRLEPHYAGDRLEALGIDKPQIALAALGPAEAKDPSSFYSYRQWIYPARGIAAFADNADEPIGFMYLFAPMTLAEYRQSWMWRTQMWEEPMR